MNDRDLRDLLASLDDVEPAPPELVERVWRDVQGLLVDGVETSPGDVDAAADVVSIEWVDASSRRRVRRRGGVWLAVATVTMLVGLAIVTFALSGSGPDDVAVDPEPPGSVEPADTRPDRIDGACAAFRGAVADASPFAGEVASETGPAIEIWVDALGTLIGDVDRIGLPEGAEGQLLTLQLLRTALRASELGLADGDVDGAATALANAAGHRDRVVDGTLRACFEPA